MLKTSLNGKGSCFFTIEVSEYHLRLSPLFSSTIQLENHDRLSSQEHLFVSSFATRYLPIIEFACAELHTRTADSELTETYITTAPKPDTKFKSKFPERIQKSVQSRSFLIVTSKRAIFMVSENIFHRFASTQSISTYLSRDADLLPRDAVVEI